MNIDSPGAIFGNKETHGNNDWLSITLSLHLEKLDFLTRLSSIIMPSILRYGLVQSPQSTLKDKQGNPKLQQLL